jgi:hypothetical protein
MLNIHSSTRVFLCSQAIDMRLSFDGLAGMVKSHFSMPATCGHLFVFFSRRRDRMKLLFWNPDGFWLCYHRLERGTFSWLDDLDLGDCGEMEAADFAIILEGINPVPTSREKRDYGRNNLKAPSVPPLQLV